MFRRPEGLKTIRYRNGVIEFRIPSGWKEEYSDMDGGTFYDPRPDSGTLRLKVTTATRPDEAPKSAASVLEDLVRSQVDLLPNQNALAKFDQSATEDGRKIKIFYWLLSNVIAPVHVRVANFSYTILTDQDGNPTVAEEIRMLDREIRAAVFSREIGVSGAFHVRTPPGGA